MTKKNKRLLAKKLQKFYLKNTIKFIVVVARWEERIKSNQGKLYISLVAQFYTIKMRRLKEFLGILNTVKNEKKCLTWSNKQKITAAFITSKAE